MDEILRRVSIQMKQTSLPELLNSIIYFLGFYKEEI